MTDEREWTKRANAGDGAYAIAMALLTVARASIGLVLAMLQTTWARRIPGNDRARWLKRRCELARRHQRCCADSGVPLIITDETPTDGEKS